MSHSFHLFHLFSHKNILSVCHVPGTVLGSVDTTKQIFIKLESYVWDDMTGNMVYMVYPESVLGNFLEEHLKETDVLWSNKGTASISRLWA